MQTGGVGAQSAHPDPVELRAASLDSAFAAIEMYLACERIEQLEHAVVRTRGDGYGCPACGSSPASGVEASFVVRHLVNLARVLLRRAPDDDRAVAPAGPSQRVVRLRNELHVTANRVSRFGDDDHPFLDPVRITAPIAPGAVLAPEHLLFQLDLAAGRLVALLDPLSPDDWARTGRMGNGLMTLGELVERVLHRGIHDLMSLLDDGPVLAPERVVARRRPRPRWRSGSTRAKQAVRGEAPSDVTLS